jgi:hypothetical protein
VGLRNIATGACSTVGGGTSNTASATYSTISGGYGNCTRCHGDFIGGGLGNQTFGFSILRYSVVSGGRLNCAGSYSTVGGGCGNSACNISTIAGGICNCACGPYSTVSGGQCNSASAAYSTVIGGQCNCASGCWASVSGGLSNNAVGHLSSIINGCCSTANACYSTVLNGYCTITRITSEVTQGYVNTSHAGKFQHRMITASKYQAASGTSYLSPNGDTERITVPAESIMSFTAKVSAYNSTTNGSAWWEVRSGIRRDNLNNTQLIGCQAIISGVDPSFGSHSMTITADDTNEALNIGINQTDTSAIYWGAAVDAMWTSSNVL